MVAAGGEPAVARERMLGDEAGVEARGLGAARHLGDGGAADELVTGVDAVGRKLQGEAHSAAAYAQSHAACSASWQPRRPAYRTGLARLFGASPRDPLGPPLLRLRREVPPRAARWLASEVPAYGPRRAPSHDWNARRAYDTGWQRKLFDAGYAGINWPKEYGGRDASLTEQLVYYEEIARARAPYVGTNFVGLLHGGPTIMAEGTPEQKALHIGPIIRGEQIWCQGFSEPGAGSDLAALSTRAERDGDHYVVSGHKIWTSFAQVADYCELLVRTDPNAPKHRGITWLAMPMTLPGIEIRPLPTLMGIGRVLGGVPRERARAGGVPRRRRERRLARHQRDALVRARHRLRERHGVPPAVGARPRRAREAGHARRRVRLGRPRAAPRDRPHGRRARRAVGDGEVHGLRGGQDGRAADDRLLHQALLLGAEAAPRRAGAAAARPRVALARRRRPACRRAT